MAILDFFMESPGDRKRREKLHQDRLGLIDAETSANIKQAKELRDSDQLHRDFTKNKRDFEYQQKLANVLVQEQGVDPTEAMLLARQQMNQMAVKPDQEALSSAQVAIGQNQGMLPYAQRIGESTGFATTEGNLANAEMSNLQKRIARARLGTAPQRAVAEDTSAEKEAALQEAISSARIRTAPKAAVDTDVLSSAQAQDAQLQMDARQPLIPAQANLESLGLNYNLSMAQGADPVKDLEAQNAKRAAEMTSARLRGMYPLAGTHADSITGSIPGIGPQYTAEALGVAPTSATPRPTTKRVRRTQATSIWNTQ